MALTTAAIRQADPDAVIVQVEAVGWHWASDGRWQAEAGRALWIDETIAAVADARADGVPVVGYTWFPAMTMIDWEYRLTTQPIEDYLLHLGLWDSAYDADGVLQRHATPLVERYRRYVAQGSPGRL